MLSNFEIFIGFLAMRGKLTDIITAYTKRYDICANPFFRMVKNKANAHPKTLFNDVLGTHHKFKDLEEKWVKYVEDTIDYVPVMGDYVICQIYDEKADRIIEKMFRFIEGSKESFIDDNGITHNEQITIKKYNI